MVCFAIFGRLLGFGGKQFSRENVPEMTGGQRAILGGRACPEGVLKGNRGKLRLVSVRVRAWCVLRFSGVFRVLAENSFHGRMRLK